MVVGELTQEVDLVVIGGGPGGYVAALAAADNGIATALIEEAKIPGGVCLREGCIPSKALLHVAKVVEEAKHAEAFGVTFEQKNLDIEKLRNWKNGVIRKLGGGVQSLIKARKIEYFNGRATFEGSNIIRIEGTDNTRIKFRNALVATGAAAKYLPESL
ncbi:MAG TPA: FAD-dependent oxidoreductase, partial [Phycisphaerae bacterium]|nr:FAD-dependent oxidoreductase [Phycisphaerae bacterium]